MSSELLQQPERIDEAALDTIFRNARTSRVWLDKPVPEAVVKELYALLRLGPTSANLTPGRFVFVISPAAKERLLPAMSPGNVEKTKTAPVTVIVGYDTEFYLKGPHLNPSMDVRAAFEGNPEKISAFGQQNANLQAAYLIIAARALGLAAGPMGGFDAAAVDREFFPDGKWRSLVVINLGYPDLSNVPPRLPRLEFEDAAVVL